jgi:hypothetical protein
MANSPDQTTPKWGDMIKKTLGVAIAGRCRAGRNSMRPTAGLRTEGCS